MEQKYQKLVQILKDCGSVAVAYSGGVDSALLLHVARSVLGDAACAVTAKAEAVPEAEIQDAVRYCRDNQIRHKVVEVSQMDIPEFVQNTEERCYFCKRKLFGLLAKEAASMGYSYLAEGTNADDTSDFRPGMRAVRELGVLSPLKEAGLTKSEIRALSRTFGLKASSRPSSACLATRIPYGDRITQEKLAMAGRSEAYLHELGFGQVRVRVHSSLARIEVTADQIARFGDPSLREEVCAKLKEYGFTYVSLDLAGYRTGSMNEVLAESDMKTLMQMDAGRDRGNK